MKNLVKVSLSALCGLVFSTSAMAEYAYFSAHLQIGDQCGNGDVVNWSTDLDNYTLDKNTAPTSGHFNAGTGVYTAPMGGVYRICAALRTKAGGNGDFTIRHNGQRIAAFGSNKIQSSYEWSSSSTCTLVRLAFGDTLKIAREGTSGSDCIEETNFRYGQFNANYIRP